MTFHWLMIIFLGIVLPKSLFVQTASFIIVSPDGRKMDYEGEMMNEPSNKKQMWYWAAATVDGGNKLISQKDWSAKQLQLSSQSCLNGSSVQIARPGRAGQRLWNTWATLDGGYIKSKCGPGFRLRRVGGWVKVINDDPCRYTEDDKFDFQYLQPGSSFT